ncbi:hypothetical protein [Nocardiopsis dassonvillei]|uniref:hypothetical protein n=1 Tax=Nocardiopsis dassonvillei TaxID=2014 RepID=UPI003F567ED1
MIRLTHRLCRTETEGLADTADRLTERLRDEEMATGHLLEELTDACRTQEHAAEAVIPDHVRERLLQAHQLPEVTRERDDALAQVEQLTSQLQGERNLARAARERYVDARGRMLAAAHTAGMLARTYALVDGAGMAREGGAAEQILVGVRALRWHYVPGWECQDSTCHQGVRELLWHETAPERAHLVCECGRIWQAEPGDVARGERETRTHQALGSSSVCTRRWSEVSGPVLEAVDRALPPPDAFRQEQDDVVVMRGVLA